MQPLGIFGVSAGISALYANQRYSGNINYSGPAVDTPAGGMQPETGAPGEGANTSILIAAGIAAAIGVAFLAGPKLALGVGAAQKQFAADYQAFSKVGAGLLGAGVGTGAGVLTAR